MYKTEMTPDLEVIVGGDVPHVEGAEYMPDVGHLAPDLLPYMRDGEKIINVEYIPRHHKDHKPSALHELLRLTRSHNTSEIGKNGPVIAATSLEDDETRSELHLYEAVFGRDSLFVAQELLETYPELARATLIKLASLQGIGWNEASEEEPGRIPHEIRDPKSDSVARTLCEERGWDWPYYGAVDATPMFLRVFVAYAQRAANGMQLMDQEYVAKDGTKHKMSESLDAALGWVHKRMSANPEGFVEYKSSIPGGIENQVWRDSWDSYFHADGSLANRNQGIASLDVQRITYDALYELAGLYESIPGRQGESRLLYIQASLLRNNIIENFWVEKSSWNDGDDGFFALGTDRDDEGTLRPLKIKTSDMGHLLNSHILDGDDPRIVRRREAVIKQLFSAEMLSAGGIRTLASDEQRFRPGAYHNGSVWPAFNYLIAQGLRRHGYDALAHDLDNRIMNNMNETGELMEYVRGGDGPVPVITERVVDIWDPYAGRVNRIEQPPQEVQAWTVAAILAIKLANAKNHSKNIIPMKFEDIIIEKLAA